MAEATKPLPAPSHAPNDFGTAHQSTNRPAAEVGSFVPVKVVAETALPAPGPHVSDEGRS